MSEVQNTQTAVDAPNATAEPAVAGNDAQNGGDDLDKLLSRYDESTERPAATSQTQPEPKTGTDSDLKATLEEAKAFVGEARELRFRQDMDVLVKDVRGELDSELFDGDFVESWLDAQAKKDPRLQKAWLNRHANPQGFAKVKTELGRTFQKKYGKLPDKAATEDREAVTAAVRGASTTAPIGKPPNLSNLTDAQFAAEKDKMFGT